MMTRRGIKLPFIRSNQSGQALVILALGFIGLLGFVGIVTDVSLLLVRYSTLSRAVDSAAIAAAGQYRTDRTYAEMSLAAREMIVLHGLDPEDVIVETCETTIPLDPVTGDQIGDGDEFLCEQNRNRKLVRVGAEVMSPTVFMRVLGFDDFPISAVAISETAALDIVLVMDVSESMLADTTYAQWADIGMGQVYVPPRWRKILKAEVTANRFTNNPAPTYPLVTADPTDAFDDRAQFWYDILNSPQEIVNRRLDYGAAPNVYSATENPSYPVKSFPYPGAAGTQNHPRPECRVRFWPYADSVPVPDHLKNMNDFWSRWFVDPLPAEGNDPAETEEDYEQWQGFVPAYDFYGCCNDPTSGGEIIEVSPGDYTLQAIPGQTLNLNSGDNNFSDLICEPFRQARNATREFLQRVDFDRGDRVAFVTFDKSATIIDPDGSVGFDDSVADGNTHWCQIAEGEDVDGSGRTTFTHMISDLVCAEETLNRAIGVRAEANYYGWKQDGGGWSYFANGLEENTGISQRIDYYSLNVNDADLARNDYPIRGNCSFQNASLTFYQSLYSLWNWNLANPVVTLDPQLRRIMYPNPDDPGWDLANLDPTGLNSYELQADCRGTNFGAALREANNALLDPNTTRREGTVWVMVFLSDGAAGASDPVRRAGEKPNRARPYYDRAVLSEPYEAWRGINNLVRFGKAAEEQAPGISYGWFGLCPVGTPGAPGQLTRTDRLAEFPFCSDELPHTRHFCTPPGEDPINVGKNCANEGASVYASGFAPGSRDNDYDCSLDLDVNLSRGNVYDVDIGAEGAEGACSIYYDVDDYARDWADYVGLSKTSSAEQLPTIFTIGFGLHFKIGSPTPNLDPGDPNYVPGTALENVPDYLGEELLRYIADVGDNSRVDTDYQQDLLDDRDQTLNGFLTEGSFGLRGPCEDPNVKPDVSGTAYSNTAAMIAPLPPRQDCGNYFNAPDQARLELVFDEIASRMFTRLAP